MTTWVRVRDRDTGHEYDVAESAFRPEVHVKVNKPAQYPDLSGPAARPRPAKHSTDKAGRPATRAVSQSATEEKENHDG